jgi:RNA polymerase sigma-70 factor, ECF subfamily
MNEASEARMDADLEAIRRCLAGDQQAFTELLERHKAVVYSLARNMLGDATEAEDAAQEAFVKAYFALPNFRRECSFRSWICQITNRLCIDRIRARRAEKGKVAITEIPEPSIEGHDEAIITKEQLNLALSRLPEQFRAILVMRHMEELSYEEIATALDMPLGTVKTQIHRARAALKKEFDRFRDEESGTREGLEEA